MTQEERWEAIARLVRIAACAIFGCAFMVSASYCEVRTLEMRMQYRIACINAGGDLSWSNKCTLPERSE